MDGVNSPKTPTEKTALHPCPPSPPWEVQSSQEALQPHAEGLPGAALGALLAHPSRTSELPSASSRMGGITPTLLSLTSGSLYPSQTFLPAAERSSDVASASS